MFKAPSGEQRSAAPSFGYGEAGLMVAVSTLVGLAIAPTWGTSSVDLLYLPAVLAAAILSGLGPALAAALCSALAYDFFFTEPRFSLNVQSADDVLTVLVLFGAAVVTSQLAASVRRQAIASRADAARNATIAGVARHLLGCTSKSDIVDVTARELGGIFHCHVAFVCCDPELHQMIAAATTARLAPTEMAMAALVFETGERAGRGTGQTLPSEWQFHPVRAENLILAVVGLARDDGGLPVERERVPLLDSLLDQVALALERARLEGEARDFARTRERDQVRSVLLASLGQDIRPPLQDIANAVAQLRRTGSGEKELVAAIGADAAKIDRHLSHLLDLGPATDQRPLAVGGIAIDLLKRLVTRDGEPVHLTPKEFSLLSELAKYPGRILTHAHLLRAVWGPAHEGQIDYLRVAIRSLRQKLEVNPSEPRLIVNEPAVGYRLVDR